jgi:agmatinase
MRLISANMVEVAPACDHDEVTAVAASHIAYEFIALLGLTQAIDQPIHSSAGARQQ